MAVSSKLITWRGKQGSTEASDLGWRAGEWPQTLEVKSSRTEHVERFDKVAHRLRRNEFIGCSYRSTRGLNLMVFND